MTKEHYIMGETYKNPASFSGQISLYDFDGYVSISDMAARISATLRFDSLCKLQAENRNKRYKERKLNA